jgi:hypothetical protein
MVPLPDGDGGSASVLLVLADETNGSQSYDATATVMVANEIHRLEIPWLLTSIRRATFVRIARCPSGIMAK